MSTGNRVNLVHSKAIGSTNTGFHFNTRLGNFNNATRLTLVGYSIGGIPGAAPNHLLLQMSDGSNQTYTNVQQERNTLVDVNANFKMLFPATGTQSQYRQELLNTDGSRTFNLQGIRFELLTFKPASSQYEPFIDYTEIAMEFEIEMFSESKVVKRV